MVGARAFIFGSPINDIYPIEITKLSNDIAVYFFFNN